jgi:2-Cys peroxiredoxin 5
MFSAARSLPLTRSVAGRRLFHASAPVLVKVGDRLPDVDLVEGSPGNKVNLAKELTGKGIIIGMRLENNHQFGPDCHLRCSRCLLTFML